MDCSHQAPSFIGFSRQEYWSGVPLPSPIQHANAYIWNLERWLRLSCMWDSKRDIDVSDQIRLDQSLSRVWLFATPWTVAYQAPLSMGFSRQEHWSELSFPSPMHESEKWKWSCSVVYDSQWPHGLQPTWLLHPWDFPGKSTGVGCHCLLQYMLMTSS